MLTSREPARTGPPQDVDTRIVEALRSDGRISTNELADHLGLSRTTTARRLSHLIEGGFVTVVGVVHPLTLGITSLAHVAISVDTPVREVAQSLAALSTVPFVSLTSGPFPLIVEVRARSESDLAAILNHIRSVPGVRSTETLVYTDLLVDVLRTSRAEPAVIDRVDARCSPNCRSMVGCRTPRWPSGPGCPPGTARTRVMRMIADEVVRIGAIVKSGLPDTQFDVGVGISLRGPALAGGGVIAAMPAVRFLAATLGRYDLLATLHVETLAEVVSTLDYLRGLDSILRIDSWVHLDTVKENYHYQLVGMVE